MQRSDINDCRLKDRVSYVFCLDGSYFRLVNYLGEVKIVQQLLHWADVVDCVVNTSGPYLHPADIEPQGTRTPRST